MPGLGPPRACQETVVRSVGLLECIKESITNALLVVGVTHPPAAQPERQNYFA